MAELQAVRAPGRVGTDKGVAAIGTAGGFTALLSAAACCVLPLAFALVGLGSGGLAFLVPYHWPLTIGAALAVAAGWTLYLFKRRACAAGDSCTPAPSMRATLLLLSLATAFVLLSAVWPGFVERPLMRLLGGA